jgi:hypothetical protein
MPVVRVPFRHVSLHVPWHDLAWTGTACKDPRSNAACLVLRRIREARWERKLAWHREQKILPREEGAVKRESLSRRGTRRMAGSVLTTSRRSSKKSAGDGASNGEAEGRGTATRALGHRHGHGGMLARLRPDVALKSTRRAGAGQRDVLRCCNRVEVSHGSQSWDR